ncbi:regulator of G protein signaling-like protein [Azospirillum brasilense]|uniref:Regulator of G protein signaling-like protein n=1 Tax=Azospirillum brasilense TaxID=192 RepID=A0A560BPL6_AZOBR|nr:hypothetical protein [Azospirillum brasilense]TWA74563.1 regulator of G protein signaling-like protein [Azospirillum brasilense]
MKIMGYPDELIPRVAAASLGTCQDRPACVKFLQGLAVAEKAFESITWNRVMLHALTKPEPLDDDVSSTYEAEVVKVITPMLLKLKVVGTLAAEAAKDLGVLTKAHPKATVAKKALAFAKSVPGVTTKVIKAFEDAIAKDRKDIGARMAKDEAAYEKELKAAEKARAQIKDAEFVNPFKDKKIEDILKNNKLTLLLHAFAEQGQNGEIIEFLSLTRKGVEQKNAQKLYKTFITQNTAKGLNIPDKYRNEFLEGIEDGTYTDALKKIRAHVIGNVETHTLPLARALGEPALRKLGYK